MNLQDESTFHVNKIIEFAHDFFVRNDSDDLEGENLWLRLL